MFFKEILFSYLTYYVGIAFQKQELLVEKQLNGKSIQFIRQLKVEIEWVALGIGLISDRNWPPLPSNIS